VGLPVCEVIECLIKERAVGFSPTRPLHPVSAKEPS
jgi:hypothetical protein